MVPQKFPLLGFAVLVFSVQLCQGKGKIEIKMKRYQSSCHDNWGLTQCDTYFYLCIDKPGPLNISSCYYKRFGPSRHYENTNTMNFGDNVGGITNPMVVSFDSVESDKKMFVVETYDKEMFPPDKYLVTMGKTFSCPAAMKESDARWTDSYMTHSGSYNVSFAYRCYCDAYYHTSKCNVYCKAHGDFYGHYTCNEQTGEKICMRGWTGDNCATDIDECEAGPCYNKDQCKNLPGTYQCICPNGFTGWTGDNCATDIDECEAGPCYNKAQCKNLPGTYQCICPNGFTGQNCDLIESLCHSEPCQHNGTCSGDMQNYTCSCPFEWKGTDCEIQAVDWVPIVIAFVCTLLLVLLLLALVYIRRRRRQKKELQASLSNQEHHTDVVKVAGHDNLAYHNALYDETNRANIDRSSCQQMPLPTPPSTMAPHDDLFNPVKPKLLSEDAEQGAMGGANPYQDIDGGYLNPVTCATGREQKKVVGRPVLITHILAGAGGDGVQKGASNPYADFEDLKRRSIAARQDSETVQMNPDSMERLKQAEENHHDLDDVCLAIKNDTNGTVHFNPNAAAASSHFIPTGNDATLIINMAEGTSGRQDPEHVDSTDEEEDGVNQEDIEQLRREVLQASANTASNVTQMA